MTNEYFDNKLNSNISGLDLLPIFHTCESYYLNEILRHKKLIPQLQTCKDFLNEELLYLFYGRPAYRSSVTENSDLTSYLPACFIINPGIINNIKRIIPFDSGAFTNGLYADFLHSKMEINQFFLKPELNSIIRMIGYFFQNNANYFNGVIPQHLDYDPLDFPKESYSKLIRDAGKSVVDDRKASIEIQMSAPLELTEKSLMAVILPKHLCVAEIVQEVLVKELKVEIIPYNSYGIASHYYYTQILDLAKQFLIKRNYLNEA
ncbi:MAG: hypothetical protein NTW29_13285 [Bacteroidetes bacterium]|nr:hypothetical protein [Bacteroidota bacterium]